ncbi:MAG: hypothetical protein ACTSR8_05965 [Promethearchaeota archaeon]
MNNKTPKGELNEEISKLEDTIKGALFELTDLENNLLDIIAPSGRVKTDGNYFSVIRRFQNAMKVALIDGLNKKDLEIFEEAFNFYNSALDLTTATGNLGEVEQVKHEFLKQLLKISADSSNIEDPKFLPFVYRTCKSIAEIYDSMNQFSAGIEFHNRAGNLQKKPLIAHIEYLQVVLDYLLLKEIKEAEEYYPMMPLKNFQLISKEIIIATKEKNILKIEDIQKKTKVLGAQRRIDVKNALLLINRIKQNIQKDEQKSGIETLPPPQTLILSNEKLESIKESLAKGIQRIQAAHPNIQMPVIPQIDTNKLVSELKATISQEINKELKNLSKDLVSNILKKLPSGTVSSPPLRSAGQISDFDKPNIEVIQGAPTEKPKRPKLDDMLDSIIVSE